MEWLVYYLVIAALVAVSFLMGWWSHEEWEKRREAPHGTDR